MWIWLVEMNVWIRQRSAPFSASAARSMSPGVTRASAAITGPRTLVAISRTASNSPSPEIGKPASRMSTLEPGELLRDLDLLGPRERDAGRLLAVAQRRVEDPYLIGAGYRFAA